VVDASRLAMMESSVTDEIKNMKETNCSYYLSKELMSGRVLFTE